VRLGIFAAVFTVLYLVLPAPLESVTVVGFAAIVVVTLIAAIIALTLSYIFLGRLRDAVALDLASRRGRPPIDPDAHAEDADVESAVRRDSSEP
jgi:hypothetical protein